MRAGRLRHRVTLQRLERERDEVGEERDLWVDVATVPGEYLELRGSEFLRAREIHHDVVAQVRIRYRSDVEPEWRLVFRDRPYRIEHVIDLAGKQRELELLVATVR